MKVAVVILNWNGKKLITEFLPSVVTHSEKATVYIADNASDDDSVSYIKEYFPSVKIVQNKINGGYAKGYNDALKDIEADVFCLLNNDVEVSKNWLNPIIETYNNDSKIAILQPKILDYKQKDKFEYAGAAGGFIDKFGYPYCRGRIFDTIENDQNQYNDIVDIFWASGACLFIKKSVFQDLNGFDESFFAHMEEIDLCWRAKNIGLKVKYVGTSTVYHLGGGTLSAVNPKKTYLNFRNSLFTLVKNAGGRLWFIIFIRLILDGIAGLHFILKLKPKHTLAIIKAHFSFYANLKLLIAQRKTLQHTKNYYNTPSIIYRYFVARKKYFNS